MNKEFYTIQELSILLGLSDNSIRMRIKRGQLKAKKLGKRVLIPKSEVDKLINSLQEWGNANSKN